MKGINIYKEAFTIVVNVTVAYAFVIVADVFTEVGSTSNLILKTIIGLSLVLSLGYTTYKLFKKYSNGKQP